MIVFLTLCYVGVLALLIKLKIVPLNLWTKLSPIIWMVLLFVVLFIPMQWGAPGGPVNVIQRVVEIVPNVSGEVIEVIAEGNQPLKKGDVLFRIDPRPFQYQVDRLLASLVEAEVKVSQLTTQIAEATANRNALKAQLKLATLRRKDVETLVERNVRATNDLDKAIAEEDSLTEQVRAAEERIVSIEQQLGSTINGEHTSVAQLRAQLADAEYNLAETVVRAPEDGQVVGLTLQPGQRVANFPVRSWMAFVVNDSGTVLTWINQNVLRYVKAGAPAEVTFKLLPGRIFSATVESVVYMTGQGQLQASGVAPTYTPQQGPGGYGVRLKLDDNERFQDIVSALNEVPGAAVGSSAIYTESAKPTQIIRRVMIRMDAWLNYIMP